ncbi:MAG: zinc ribbon domain-containing protein, partial [Chloroflexia bacterium]
MRCPNCGNENPPDYVFCDECGARLQEGEGTENSPNIPAQEESTPPTDTGAGNEQNQGEQSLSSMIVTPSQEETPAGGIETEPEALNTPMSDATTGPTEGGAEDEAAVPLTEDTAAATMPADNGGISGDESGLSAQPMPDVVEMGASEGSRAGTDQVEIGASPVSAPDISPAASGTPAVADDGGSAEWAST